MDCSNVQPVSVCLVLRDLCKEAQSRFRAAAAMTSSTALRMVLDTYAQQRLLFEDALQEEIRTLGGDRMTRSAEGRSSFVVNVLGLGGSQEAILAYCERGEELSIHEYIRGAATNLPPRVRSVIEYQLGRMVAAKARFRALRGLEPGVDDESELIRRNGDMGTSHNMPPVREASGQLLHV